MGSRYRNVASLPIAVNFLCVSINWHCRAITTPGTLAAFAWFPAVLLGAPAAPPPNAAVGQHTFSPPCVAYNNAALITTGVRALLPCAGHSSRFCCWVPGPTSSGFSVVPTVPKPTVLYRFTAGRRASGSIMQVKFFCCLRCAAVHLDRWVDIPLTYATACIAYASAPQRLLCSWVLPQTTVRLF